MQTEVAPDYVAGIPNLWYIVGPSALLAENPTGMRLFGEDLVLWRDSKGAPHLFEDWCAHRGAQLSCGFVAGDELQCWYHGWRYDPAGLCVSIPAQGGPPPGAPPIYLKSYPVTEKAGYLWAYFGDAKRSESPPSLVLPAEFEEEGWSSFIEHQLWDVNWLLILENLADIMHAPYLHGYGAKLDRVKAEKKENGLLVRRDKHGLSFDWNEVNVANHLIYMRYDIPYTHLRAAGPGGPLRIISFATPIDEAHTHFFPIRFRNVQGWKRAYWRVAYRLWLAAGHRRILEQDREIIESQRDVAMSRGVEHLKQSDAGVIALRKVFDELYEGGWHPNQELRGERMQGKEEDLQRSRIPDSLKTRS